MEEDRSALFNQLKNFSQRKLKKVETKVVTASGEQLVEKRGAKGLQVFSGSAGDGSDSKGTEPARKLDLQVGLVLPGFLIASQDVAHDKSSLDSYGITHILNLDANVENKFEDDYNYKNIAIQDKPDFELERILEDCFDFIDDGRHYGNVLVHCSGTIGLSRSTSICIAYLMNKEKQKFDEAFNNVKEVRSFVKPNEGFIKQLRDYETKLRGAQQVKESGIDDPFALRKKQEIEQEKAMVAGAASVRDRMKMFGANLDTASASGGGGSSPSARSKSVSPAPSKMLTSSSSSANNNNNSTTSSVASKWAPVSTNASKSMTPEPRKSWQSQAEPTSKTGAREPSGPAPPPPPMPTTSLHTNDKSIKQTGSTHSAGLPPPPPPPPPGPGELLKSEHRSAAAASKPPPSSKLSSSTTPAYRKQSVSETSDDETSKQKLVFGRRPPPPMKIRGGLSIERQDSIGDRNVSHANQTIKSSTQSKASLQLPLKKQFTTDSSDGESGFSAGRQSQNPRAPSPSAALRAAKQQVSNAQQQDAKANSQYESSSAGHQRRPSKGQLNRSSTKKLLNLIKTKTRSDLTLPDGDENDEIDALLGALENESIENIDWDELGLDEDEVKDIIRCGGDDFEASATSSSSEEESEDEDEDEEEEEEVETSTQHYVIRTKY